MAALSAVRKDPGHYQRTFSFLPGTSATVELGQTGRSALTRCVCESPACLTCWRSWSLRGAAERPELAGVILAVWKPTAPNRNA
jgi:hypothetical protein